MCLEGVTYIMVSLALILLSVAIIRVDVSVPVYVDVGRALSISYVAIDLFIHYVLQVLHFLADA